MSQSRPSFLQRLLGRDDPKAGLMPLYHAVVAEGRQPHWYLQGGVPDTLDGRFDMIVAILAQVLMRLEALGAAQDSVWLTELFVDDMDGQLREAGVGDMVVGKRIGKLVSAMGGRLGAYRAALAETDDAALIAALERNVTLVEGADRAALAGQVRALSRRLAAVDDAALLAGAIA